MSEKYKIIITPQAKKQLIEIRDYISFEMGSEIAAGNTMTVLENAVKSLEQMPNRFPLVEEEQWANMGVHKLSVKNYFIYFLVKEQSNSVYIVAFVYARRDQKKFLQDNI